MFAGPKPFRAVIVVEADVAMAWRLLVCDRLVEAGCLYAMAWGHDCEIWHDCVDECNLDLFDFGDIPDDRFVMTTWHAGESLRAAFEFCHLSAEHPTVPLDRTIILHVAEQPNEAKMLAAFHAARD